MTSAIRGRLAMPSLCLLGFPLVFLRFSLSLSGLMPDDLCRPLMLSCAQALFASVFLSFSIGFPLVSFGLGGLMTFAVHRRLAVLSLCLLRLLS